MVVVVVAAAAAAVESLVLGFLFVQQKVEK